MRKIVKNYRIGYYFYLRKLQFFFQIQDQPVADKQEYKYLNQPIANKTIMYFYSINYLTPGKEKPTKSILNISLSLDLLNNF